MRAASTNSSKSPPDTFRPGDHQIENQITKRYSALNKRYSHGTIMGTTDLVLLIIGRRSCCISLFLYGICASTHHVLLRNQEEEYNTKKDRVPSTHVFYDCHRLGNSALDLSETYELRYHGSSGCYRKKARLSLSIAFSLSLLLPCPLAASVSSKLSLFLFVFV